MPRPRRVVYVSHTSKVSGAEHALLELFRHLPDAIEPTLACPEGRLAELSRGAGVAVRPIRGTSASLRMGPRDGMTAVRDFVASTRAIRRITRQLGADLVHANSIRAGLMSVLPGRPGGTAVLVHVHDALPLTPVSWLARQLLAARATSLVAVSAFTADRFTTGLRRSPARLPVLYNPIDVERFSPSAVPRSELRARLGLPPDAPCFAVIAQITPWKAQDTAIRALAHLRERHPDARLLLVGEAKFVSASTRFDNLQYLTELRELVAGLGLEGAVDLWGEREDVPDILRCLDAVLVPSWDEPLGRTMLEAMSTGTPVVASRGAGPAEVLADGRTGLLVSPGDAAAFAAACGRLLEEPGLAAALSREAAGEARERFAAGPYTEAILRLYDSCFIPDARAAATPAPRSAAP